MQMLHGSIALAAVLCCAAAVPCAAVYKTLLKLHITPHHHCSTQAGGLTAGSWHQRWTTLRTAITTSIHVLVLAGLKKLTLDRATHTSKGHVLLLPVFITVELCTVGYQASTEAQVCSFCCSYSPPGRAELPTESAKVDTGIYHCTDYLSSVRCYSHRRLISTFRCGCHGHMLTQAALARLLNIAAGRTGFCFVCMSGSFKDEHLFDCPAYSHIRQQYSNLSHQASSSVAAFLATD